MKTTIFILSWCSYTNTDDYLYTDIQTFTDEEEARRQFDDDCHKAYEECEWGSQWDESEDSRDEDCKYDVDESRDPGTYTVSSQAYDGYKVEVSLEEREIDIPVPPVNTEKSILPAILFKEWDLRRLNSEFQKLLAEHEDDEPNVPGASHDEFEEMRSGDPEDYGGQEDFDDECQYRAQILNSWDELCMRHPGLRDSGLSWWCGASYVGFNNTWDLYIGTGDEQD